MEERRPPLVAIDDRAWKLGEETRYRCNFHNQELEESQLKRLICFGFQKKKQGYELRDYYSAHENKKDRAWAILTAIVAAIIGFILGRWTG
jgi:hypothetical protein